MSLLSPFTGILHDRLFSILLGAGAHALPLPGGVHRFNATTASFIDTIEVAGPRQIARTAAGNLLVANGAAENGGVNEFAPDNSLLGRYLPTDLADKGSLRACMSCLISAFS